MSYAERSSAYQKIKEIDFSPEAIAQALDSHAENASDLNKKNLPRPDLYQIILLRSIVIPVTETEMYVFPDTKSLRLQRRFVGLNIDEATVSTLRIKKVEAFVHKIGGFKGVKFSTQKNAILLVYDDGYFRAEDI